MRGTNCGRQEGSAGSGQPRAHALDHCERHRILTVPNLTPEIFQSSQDFGELRFADSVEGQYRLMKIIMLKTALMLGAEGSTIGHKNSSAPGTKHDSIR
jgi:hypothetical protein